MNDGVRGDQFESGPRSDNGRGAFGPERRETGFSLFHSTDSEQQVSDIELNNRNRSPRAVRDISRTDDEL
jgi:hypothetical protein